VIGRAYRRLRPLERSTGSREEPLAPPAHAGRTQLANRSAADGATRIPIDGRALEFSFTLTAPAKVHVTLVEQTSSHGHKHWTTLPDSLTANAGKGRGSGKLTGHNRLSPGRYRLTLKPSSGRSRSIYLTARP
jgi:hypothetical protein